jgi:hypothetical protein
MTQDAVELRRPKLLLDAARRGMRLHDRERDVPRLLGSRDVPEDALDRLLKAEAEQEELRLQGAVNYSVSRHVDLLAAIIGECAP